MTPILANAYIPLAPVAPIAQVVLLIFIVALEAWVIAKKNEKKMNASVIWRVCGVNTVTGAIGIAIIFPVSMLEAWIAFGWGSERHINETLWWFSVFSYGLILPFATWFACYHLSWRTEYYILRKWTGHNFSAPSRASVIEAHRWSYAFLFIFVLAGCLYYWYGFIAWR